MQTIEKIGERFWYQTPVSETDRPILGMVVGRDRKLMIDAGNSEAHAAYFLRELAEQGVPAPDLVVLTHWHWDHIFGLSYLQAQALSISSAKTKKAVEQLVPLAWDDEALDRRVQEGTEIEFCASAIKKEFPAHRDIRIALPAITFEEQLHIDLGGITCVLQQVGGDHAADSVVVYIPEEKLLFLGDCIYADIYSPKRNHTPAQTVRLLDLLEAYDAETYVLSHWKPVSRAEFQEEAFLLRTLARLTEELSGDGVQMQEAYSRLKGRALTEDELETLQYFVNGYELQR